MIKKLPGRLRILAATFFTLGFSAAVVLPSYGADQAARNPSRIVAVGGSVTEIVYALGEEERLVARDSTSTYPSAAEQDLPDIGYMRALSAEGVLSVSPDMLLILDGSGPPETLDLLEKTGIAITKVPEQHSGDGILEKVRVIGAALNVPEKAKTLSENLKASLLAAEEESSGRAGNTKVLFVLSTKGGRILAAGKDTAADGILQLAGARNATPDFSGYKQLTDEAILKAAPDVILMMSNGGDHAAAEGGVLEHPAIATTPAGTHKRLIRMPGNYLLGFGPRTADAIRELSAQIAAYKA